MRKEYNKLVRDRIPEIIRQVGHKYEVTTLSDSEYHQALRNKLLEEAQEVASATPEDLIKEIADLYEVIDAVLAAHRIHHDAVLEEQKRRRVERGGFKQRICLLWTED